MKKEETRTTLLINENQSLGKIQIFLISLLISFISLVVLFAIQFLLILIFIHNAFAGLVVLGVASIISFIVSFVVLIVSFLKIKGKKLKKTKTNFFLSSLGVVAMILIIIYSAIIMNQIFF